MIRMKVTAGQTTVRPGKPRGGDCEQRVLRGGSWLNFPDDLRSAYRYGPGAVDRDYHLGFRLVCRPPSSTDH